MLNLLVHLLEVAIVSLIAFGGFRVFKLAENDPVLASSYDNSTDEPIMVETKKVRSKVENQYQLKMASLKQAQAFAGNQLFEIRREYQRSDEEMPEWLEEAISLYLIGAVDFISKQEQCESKTRKEIITTILKSNLKLDHANAQSYFVEAVCREPNSDSDSIVLAGATAAKAWLKKQIIPETHKLSTQVQSWGVLA